MLCVGLAFLLLFFRAYLPLVSFNVAMNALVLAFPLFALRAYSRLFRATLVVPALRALYVLQVTGLIVLSPARIHDLFPTGAALATIPV